MGMSLGATSIEPWTTTSVSENRDVRDPAPLLQLLARALEIMGPVLEGQLGHGGAEDGPLLEEQAVAGVRHDAFVELLDLAELILVQLDLTHSEGGTAPSCI